MAEDHERRIYPRYEVTVLVDYTGSEVLLYHQVENISLGGLCLQTTSIEERGTVVDLEITFPEQGAVIVTKGEIVWANREQPMDVGIRYLQLSDADKEVLRKHLTMTRKR